MVIQQRHQNFHSFIYLLIYLYITSYPTNPFIHSLNNLSIHAFVHSFIHLFKSFISEFIHSPFCCFVQLFLMSDCACLFVILQVFQQDLHKRNSTFSMVHKAASDMLERSDEDTAHLQSQLIDLTTKWDKVSGLSQDKEKRLDEALIQVLDTWALNCLQILLQGVR